jgi:pimeloyl-ACP methyl ester carboxylesterase
VAAVPARPPARRRCGLRAPAAGSAVPLTPLGGWSAAPLLAEAANSPAPPRIVQDDDRTSGETESAVSDVVLIHSTGQGAAGWRRVVHALAERGQAAHAVELPSDPGLLAADYAELIRRHVGALAAPIVLAHSGAGPLLPATARALEACHQVWLAAWVPDPEASFVQDTDLHRQAAFDPDWIGKDPTEDDAVAAAFLYHDCDDEMLEWALSTRRLFLPRGVYGERLPLAPGIPSTYVVAAHDRTIRPEWQRQMARERLGVEPTEIPTGHCPNVSQPDLLAEILVAVAEGA